MKKLFSFLIFLTLAILSLWNTEAEAQIKRMGNDNDLSAGTSKMGKRAVDLEQKEQRLNME